MSGATWTAQAIQPPRDELPEGGVSVLGENFMQGSPEASNTTSLGIRWVLNPNALQPRG